MAITLTLRCPDCDGPVPVRITDTTADWAFVVDPERCPACGEPLSYPAMIQQVDAELDGPEDDGDRAYEARVDAELRAGDR